MATAELTTRTVTRLVAAHLFQRSAVLIVPECGWTGHECDALVVTRQLKIIDLEIKRSRADLLADLKKDKWWRHDIKSWDPRTWSYKTRRSLSWPPQVWKHWYAVEKPAWRADLLPRLPEASGVIVFECRYRSISASVIRQPQPNRRAEVLDSASLIDLCRLSNLRLWDCYLHDDLPRR